MHKNKTKVPCRTIIDTGSSTNFITNELVKSLKLSTRHCYVPISALNELSTVADQWVTITIISTNNGYQKTIDCLVIPNITITPDQQIDRQSINIPSNIKLADPEFHIPTPIHLLLGAGTSLSLFSVGQIKLSQPSQNDLYLQKTLAGWIVGGTIPQSTNNNVFKCHLHNLQTDINKFWEIEEINIKRHLSKDELACEEHYKNNVTRNPDGRYVVALPFNDKKQQLGASRAMALKRLLSQEKRLQKDQELYKQYKAVIDEYIELNHMVKVEGEPEDGFFLPHHAVIKSSSQTTKVRIVFDGSALSSTGLSLNDTLMVGPTIQDDLFSFVVWFRLPNYLITGDIEKMFRQVQIREEDQRYLRILWREENGVISTFQLTTDTFGLASASYLAIRTIHQLAEDEKHRFPKAATSLKRRLYVDDFIDGAQTIEEVVQLRDEVINLLKAGGFNLRQCASNSPQVLQGLPNCSINMQLQDKNNPTLKTLGMYWNSDQDKIIYTVRPIQFSSSVTKRFIFSEISKIFDPLGLLSPVVVTIKLLMQEIWKLKLNWDESLPLDINDRWNTFASQLPALNEISFPRKIQHEQPVNIQLHGFCDASEKAYGACIYLRSIDESGNIRVGLLCAKSKVAPIKTVQTIPKLELCAALLLSNLYSTVKSAIDIQINQIFFWTDSMITLHWIRKSPHLLKTFVANRVSDIQSITNPSDWRHVRTYDNPADLLSRGILPADLKKLHIWKEGPKWLAGGEVQWPEQSAPAIQKLEVPELRKQTCLIATTIDDSITTRFSSYNKLQRVIAICLRFKKSNNNKGAITISELRKASQIIIKLAQGSSFQAEISSLQKKQPVSNKSKILSLKPFLDEYGILRVGGRLRNSELSFNQRHPIILPKSHITSLIIQQEHVNTLHGNIKLVLNNLRFNYWPIDGKNQVRKIVRKCVRCARVNPVDVNYIMGDLPKVRTTKCRPFINTGVDFCGPFYTKEKKFRNRTKVKTYVAIFICLATKAVHIEAVSDLTTEGFIGALRRFIARRGHCISIYSDNGTNFIGANNELQELTDLFNENKNNNKVHNYLTNKGITWHFIPPQSPHVGGIWEAAVKSFKYHLRRVMGLELFTFEQFITLITEIEAILNSRPLTSLSSDPNDPTALTPAHLLIGDSLMSLPDANLLNVPSNRLSIWQQIQKSKQEFWDKWHKEYLHELNIRHKWKQGEHPIKEGSIVIIRDDNLPPLQWRLGRVIEEFKGSDGVIRTVRVKTANGEMIRNVKRLAPLPVQGDNEC